MTVWDVEQEEEEESKERVLSSSSGKNIQIVFFTYKSTSQNLYSNFFFFQFMTANHTGCDDKEKLVEFGQHHKLETQLA